MKLNRLERRQQTRRQLEYRRITSNKEAAIICRKKTRREKATRIEEDLE